MKRNDFALNTFHHIVCRGSRQMNIVKTDDDRWEFVRLLFYVNDSFQSDYWRRDVSKLEKNMFERPSHWPPRDPLVAIHAFCLHDNHFHLLVEENREKGISSFMHRLPNSMTRQFNKKYGGYGTIFQGPYKSRLIETDADLHNLALYIMAKNVMERFPEGGIKGAVKNFEKAWRWALTDPFSSFADYAEERNSPHITTSFLKEKFPSRNIFKKGVRNYLYHYMTHAHADDASKYFRI